MRRLLLSLVAILFITGCTKILTSGQPESVEVTRVVTATPGQVTAAIVPTETAVPPTHTPTPTPTPDPQIFVAIFNGTDSDELDPWTSWGEGDVSPPELSQKIGVLVVEYSSAPDWETGHINSNTPFLWIPGRNLFLEAEIKIGSESTGVYGAFNYNIWMPIDNNRGLYIDCYLLNNESVMVECIKGIWDSEEEKRTKDVVFSETAAYDTWYKFRTEIDAAGKVTIFEDIEEIGSFQLTAEEIRQINEVNLNFKIAHPPEGNVIGYVDNVVVGYMEPIE